MKTHNNELEIDEDIALEKKTWTFQRVSWVVMLLILVAAMLGFTGSGGLPGISTKIISTPTIEVEYHPYLRNSLTEELTITLTQSPPDTLTLHFSKDFQERLRVEQVIPEPVEVKAGADGIVYSFSGLKPSGEIVFYTTPLNSGSLKVIVLGPGNATATLSQFVYP